MLDKSKIPYGDYCYKFENGNFKKCPYWDISEEHEDQINGYCHYLKQGDWESKGLSLLWDQVKVCDINIDE